MVHTTRHSNTFNTLQDNTPTSRTLPKLTCSKSSLVCNWSSDMCLGHHSTMTILDPKLCHDEDWIAAQVSQFHTILIYSDQKGMKILNKV
jgi:hypothetical protein